MLDIPDKNELSSIPEATSVPRRRLHPSVVWIIPIVAAIIGGWIAVQKILSQGPTITISFRSAEGLEAGTTKIKYNGVDIGTVSAVTLSKDHKGIIATAKMAADSKDMLVEDTRFWVVRPRISGGSVSGLGTLLSGSYIGMDVGKSKERGHAFTGLAVPPVVTGDAPGRFFVLKAENLGSLDYGTPLFFRRIQVGQVVAYELDKDGRSITAKVFVNAPYDQYVTPETRFWQASGIDVSLTASGISVHTESLVSIMVGGIAFETPAHRPVLPPAESNAVFTLFNDRAEALKPPMGTPHLYVLVFRQSVRGLVPGAPVEISGINIGEVVSIGMDFDLRTSGVSIPVTVKVYPDLASERLEKGTLGAAPTDHRHMLDRLVDLGFRAQLRTGNYLTGALFIAFDLFPNAAKTNIDWSQQPPRLPTVPGELQGIEQSLTNIVQKIEKLPLEAIGNDLRKAILTLTQMLADADKTVKRFNTDLVPETKSALTEARRTLEAAERTLSSADKVFLGPNAPVQQEFRDALQELISAARALRVLADYLERNPDAIIRGKKAAPIPAHETHSGKNGGKQTR
jgi:paraquat-inducible protein B